MIEADRGFNDLEGHQQRFSEFLQGELSSPPEPLPEDKAGVWRSLTADYDRYGEMSFAARQYLVAETRKTIYKTPKTLERAKPATKKGKGVGKQQAEKASPTALTTTAFEGNTLLLEQPATYLKGVCPKNESF